MGGDNDVELLGTTSVPEVTISPEDARALAEHAARKRAALAIIKEHNDAVRDAYARGAGLREIARVIGMSHQGVTHIVTTKSHYGPPQPPPDAGEAT